MRLYKLRMNAVIKASDEKDAVKRAESPVVSIFSEINVLEVKELGEEP